MNNVRIWDGNKMTFASKVKVQESTGIKSIKNQHVFEGDIIYVKHEHAVKSLESESWYIVEVNKKEKRFKEYILSHIKGSKVGCRFEKRWKYDVIGNIFENKKLLKHLKHFENLKTP